MHEMALIARMAQNTSVVFFSKQRKEKKQNFESQNLTPNLTQVISVMGEFHAHYTREVAAGRRFI